MLLQCAFQAPLEKKVGVKEAVSDGNVVNTCWLVPELKFIHLRCSLCPYVLPGLPDACGLVASHGFEGGLRGRDRGYGGGGDFWLCARLRREVSARALCTCQARFHGIISETAGQITSGCRGPRLEHGIKVRGRTHSRPCLKSQDSLVFQM